MGIEYDVKDLKLADQGLDKIEWAERRMLTSEQKKYLASWEMGT